MGEGLILSYALLCRYGSIGVWDRLQRIALYCALGVTDQASKGPKLVAAQIQRSLSEP